MIEQILPFPTSADLSADPQSTIDGRGVFLHAVGIESFETPLQIGGWTACGRSYQLPCRIACTVSLAAEKRGIHMSRMVEAMIGWKDVLTPSSLFGLLQSLATAQSAASAEIRVAFTWFYEQTSPVTQKPAPQPIATTYWADLSESTYGYCIRVPVTTLCPCSRDISDYGGHSQRGWIEAKLAWTVGEPSIEPEAVVRVLSACGSAPIFPLLKRSDERSVTMQAYENPAFVEDVTRQAALALHGLDAVGDFSLEVRNEESIHTHDAVARYRHEANRRK